jgi:uncharacterized protein (TIGR02453 family)
MNEIVMKFLADLAQNNTREWMQEHKKHYEEARKSFIDFVSLVLHDMQKVDPDLMGLSAKDCIFRINRDVRFSKNKSPYKINFSAYFALGGKKSFSGGYYFHVQPGQSFIGGGIYQPMPDMLAKIRQEIDYSPHIIHGIISNEEFKSYFGEIKGEKLKTSPKGYSSDHVDIELLRFKSFIVSKGIDDGKVSSKDFQSEIVKGFTIMKPFKDFLTTSISQ